MLFVPAAMKLMGEWNWWAPAPLRRFHDGFGLSEGGGPDESEPSIDLGDAVLLDESELERTLV
jgi:hypothetical protein